MPHDWTVDPVVCARAMAGPPGDEASWRAVDFAVTASWVVDGLHYLVDLDTRHRSDPGATGHVPEKVEYAHARWAVTDAIGAIDRCAAALGRQLSDLFPRGRWNQEMDFQQAVASLQDHPEAGPWIAAVLADAHHAGLLAFRHAAVHRVLHRHVTVSMSEGTVGSRWAPSLDGVQVDVSKLPIIARDFATRHVEDFLTRAASGAFPPKAGDGG